MKFCLLVTVALDIFIKEKIMLYIFLGFLLCHFSMQKASPTSPPSPPDIPTPPLIIFYTNFQPPAY